MTQNNQNQNTTTLQNEGQALTKLFKSQERAFAKSIKADGFDYRLGTLIKQIKETEKVTVLSKQLKKKYNISSIDRRRTSEAEWLIDNSQSVSDFVKKSKFKGTNINSLQNAMRIASKKEAEQSAKADKTPKKDAKASETVSKETDKIDSKESKVSDVGQSTTKVENFGKFDAKKLLSADDLAFEMLVQAEKHSIPTKELLLALKEQIKLLSTEEVA